MKTHEKFLDFNGKKIIFKSIDGVYWIALKPICEALNIQYVRSFKNVKKDPILGSALSKQTMQVGEKGKKQGRKMTCIPEQFIYGWIFSLRSDSKELNEYKKTCYQLLYKHFHGTITNRKELLLERKDLDTQIHHTIEDLKNSAKKYVELETLQKKRKAVSSKLNNMDKEIVKEPELF